MALCRKIKFKHCSRSLFKIQRLQFSNKDDEKDYEEKMTKLEILLQDAEAAHEKYPAGLIQGFRVMRWRWHIFWTACFTFFPPPLSPECVLAAQLICLQSFWTKLDPLFAKYILSTKPYLG